MISKPVMEQMGINHINEVDQDKPAMQLLLYYFCFMDFLVEERGLAILSKEAPEQMSAYQCSQ